MKIVFKLANVYLASSCRDGDVRLRGGRHYREGRVEVCRNQQWGRVCDDSWDENDSAVVCSQINTLVLVHFHFFWMMLDAVGQRATY